MPSDPAGRHPSGVLTRSAPDWFDDNVGYGGFYDTAVHAVGNNFLRLSLYNNDTGLGRALKIYGLTSISDGGGGCLAWVSNGVPPDTLLGTCQNIRADLPMPPGVLYKRLINQGTPLPNPFITIAPVPPATAAVLGASGFDSMTYFSTFPILIVPAGYACYLLTASGGGQYGGSFWYQVANE